MVLGPLTACSWLVMLFVGTRAVHNSWMYYHSGDGTWYSTTAWVLAHGRIPFSNIGYGYPFLLAPFARLAGSNMVAGLPYAIFFNAIVLTPIALLCIYGLTKAIGGRRFAYLTSAIWVVLPLLAIPYFYVNYHRRYVGLTLPSALGLTDLGDFPSMVFLLVAAYFAFRAISDRNTLDALTSGLAVGLAIAVKPANAIFLPAPALALAYSRQLRGSLAFAAGLVPSLICLSLWKYRGLGYLPLFHGSPQALAAGLGSLPPVAVTIDLGKYFPGSWSRLSRNIDGIREFTWSLRLLMWMILAGLIGLGRRSIAFAIFAGVWLAAFLVIKGSSVADIYGGGFFRYLAPAFPAVFLLGVSLPFLVPVYGRRLAARGDPSGWPVTARARKGVVAVAGLLSVAPIILLLVFRPLTTPLTTTVPGGALFIPINQFPVHGTRHGKTVTLTWPGQSVHGARVKYAVYRAPADQLACAALPGGAMNCNYPSTSTREVTSPHWTDQPSRGQWVYRVAVITGAVPPTGGGDYILLSRPLTVDMPA